VDVYRFDLTGWDGAEAGFVVECSKGTYVRSLARDLGEKLGPGAALSALCRESIGPYLRAAAFAWRPGEAVTDAALAPHLLPMDRLEPAAARA
jgi:tRNA pseudouridine55 synthase